jgi:hypothetical protein
VGPVRRLDGGSTLLLSTESHPLTEKRWSRGHLRRSSIQKRFPALARSRTPYDREASTWRGCFLPLVLDPDGFAELLSREIWSGRGKERPRPIRAQE